VSLDINVNGNQQSCNVTSCSIEAIGPSSPAPSTPISFVMGPQLAGLFLSPSGGLLDGQPISVTTALQVMAVTQFWLYECTSVACDPTTLEQYTTDFLGHISTLYDVHRYISYTDPVTGSTDDVDCFSTQCFLQAEDMTGAPLSAPADIWFNDPKLGISPLTDANMFGTVTLTGGIPIPQGTQSGIEACRVGLNCTGPGGGVQGIISASSSYGVTGLTPNVPWQVEAYVVEQTPTGGVWLDSAPYDVTPTPGQVIINDFDIDGFTPMPVGGIVSGKVTDLKGNPLPSNPYGGPGFGPQSGVLACPGSEVFGDADCTVMNNLLTPTDAEGNYSFWLPVGTWNIAPFTTFAGIPGAPAIEGAYQSVTITAGDPTVNLVIPIALTLTYTGPTVVTNGTTVTLSGKIVDQNGNPIGAQGVTLSLGAQSCVAWTGVTTGVATCPITFSQTVGSVTGTEVLLQDPQYEPSSAVPGYVQAPQIIAFSALRNKTYGDLPFVVSATASSGLAVTFSVTPASAGVCKSSGPTGKFISIVGAGTCTVEADQSGDTTYAPAPPVQQSFAVARANQIILLLPIANRTMLQSPVTAIAVATSGLPVIFTTTTPSVCTSTGTNGRTITLQAAGLCNLSASQIGNGNFNPAPTVSWSFTVSKAAQVIMFGPLANRALAKSPFTVAATASSGLPVAFSSTTPTVCTVSGAKVTLKARGTCSIQASQSGNGTYGPAASVTQSFRVS
jgi:hypothetical protein